MKAGAFGSSSSDLLLEPAEIRCSGRGEQGLVGSQFRMRIGEHRGIIEHDDPLELRQAIGHGQDLIDVFLVLGDEQHGAAVAHLVLDLRGRCGGIDAVDDGPERLRCEIADHPFLAGIAHDGDTLAAGEPDARQTRAPCARPASRSRASCVRGKGRGAWNGTPPNPASCARARTATAVRTCGATPPDRPMAWRSWRPSSVSRRGL